MTDGKSSGRAADMEPIEEGQDRGNVIRGLELSERFFGEYGLPMLREQFPQYMDMIAAGVAGEGSDCFGFDDAISRDHDFEAGFCLWIPDRLELRRQWKGVLRRMRGVFCRAPGAGGRIPGGRAPEENGGQGRPYGPVGAI